MPKNKTKIELQIELEDTKKKVLELEDRLKKIDNSDQVFATIFRASPSQMALTDQITGRYVEVNDAFINSLGFTRDEVIGKTATELNLFFDSVQRQDLLLRAREQGFLRNEHVLVRTKSGEVRHGIFSAEFINMDERKLLLTVMNDVTERLQAEERWQFALEGADEGVWDWDPQTNKVYYSKHWKSILGYEENEIGNTLDEWSRRVHPDDLPKVMEEVNRHFSGITPVYVSEHRIRCKDGAYKWILDSGKVMVWSADKKPLRVIGTHRDISTRKNIEAALRENEQRFSRMFHANPAVQLIIRFEDGVVLDVNESFCQQTGFERHELVGRAMRELDLWQDPLKQKWMIEELRENGKIYSVELDFWTKTRDSRTMLLSFDLIELGGVLSILTTGVDITSRKKAEQALVASEKKLKSLLNSQSHFVIRVNLEGRYTYHNAQFEKEFGWFYEPEGIHNQYVLNSVCAYHHKRVEEVVANCISQPGRVYSVEVDKPAREGGVRTTLWEFICLTDENDQPFEIQCMGVEITQRKQLEQELEVEAVRRRILFEEAPDGVLVIDTQTAGFLEFNAMAHKQLGYTREEFAKLHIFDVEVQETAEETRAHIEEVIQNGRSDFETLQRTKQGEIRHVHVTAMLVNILGKPVYYCIWRDVTESRRLESNLQKSEERYRIISDTVTDYAFSAGAAGNGDYVMDWVSGAFETITGYTFDEFVACGGWRARLHPDDRLVDDEARRELLANRKAVSEVRIFHKDGREVYLRVFARPLWDEKENRLKAVYGAVQNITERKQAEQSVRESQKRLRSLLEISQAMSASMEMKPILQKIVENATDLLKLDSGAIYTLKDGELFLEVTTPPLPSEFPDELRRARVTDHPHIQAAITSGSAIILPDATAQELSGAEKVVVESRGLRSIVYVPLMISERAIGALIIASVNKLRVFQAEEIALFTGFSGQA
ncbi:MAG TPA: PAS domain S-box protein, partial [Anaerolineales bacterium]|nr:PAS domain S-box protein [Anaerolineales bacterium]